MPDGSASKRKSPPWWGERICENGAYFCKRDRNKAGTVSIYTYDEKARQTVPVGDTDECAPEETIDEGTKGRIELALARFVLTNVEAVVREREGITKTDMYLKECVSVYSIAREAFHAEVIKKVEGLFVKAETDKADAETISALRFQVKCARDAARKERVNFAFAIKNVNRVWPKEGPKVSGMEQSEQLHFVKVLRGYGYADASIDMMIRITRGAMHHCSREGKLLYPVPEALPKSNWQIKSDEDDIVAYKLDEIVALFNAAAKQETWWRFMNLATHAPRTMTIIEAPWIRLTLGKDEEPRWNLNPPGKRRTSKRRPIIPLCPSLVAELRSWKRDAARLVSDGRGHAIERGTIFGSIRKAAGIKRGSAKSIRKFIRTWCAVNGVPETMADWFMGHADDGSETGQEHYKDKQPEYMGAVVGALEKLYDTLRERVTARRFAGGPDIQEDQPTIEDFLKTLRGSGVAKMIATG